MLRLTFAMILALAAALTGACGDDDPVTPTEPSPTEITEVFSGTLTPNGGFTHTFEVQRAGAATVRISGLEPSDAVIGLSMGPFSGQACVQQLARDNAVSGTSIAGSASSGAFCVRVFDAGGTLTGPVDYELTVTHF